MLHICLYVRILQLDTCTCDGFYQITFGIGKMKDMAIILDHVHLLYTLNGVHSQLLEGVLQHMSINTHTLHVTDFQ